jgi:hypothetical protein
VPVSFETVEALRRVVPVSRFRVSEMVLAEGQVRLVSNPAGMGRPHFFRYAARPPR